MGLDLNPIAKSLGIGSLVGGAIGGVLGGPSGIVAGANFAGSLGAQIGFYHKAEDMADRAANAAGRKFEDISERLAQRAMNHLDQFAERITNGVARVVNVYSRVSITGYTASWAMDLSSRASYASMGFCSNEKELTKCYALSGASYILLGIALFSGAALGLQIIRINKKDFFNGTIRTNVQTATDNAESTNTAKSESVQKEEVARKSKRNKSQATGLPTGIPIKC